MLYGKYYVRNRPTPIFTPAEGQEVELGRVLPKGIRELWMRLVREPVIPLAHPKWDKEFNVEADASSTGIVAVLSQLGERTGKLRPIQFFSSVLSSSQKNYSAGQLEA